MSKSVLITGGGGFVGSHLATGHLRLGHTVTVIDQSIDDTTRSRLAGATLVETELTKAALDGLDQKFDLIIHGAAITTGPQTFGQTDAGQIRQNLDLLLDTLDFAVASRAGAFVFLSSSGIFTPRDAADALYEDTAPTGTSAYALAKRLGETLLANFDAPECRLLTARLGYLYGPWETARPTRQKVSLLRQWLDAARAGQPILLSTPHTPRDWTYAPDLAAALEAALAHPDHPTLIHLGTDTPVRDADVAAAIKTLLPHSTINTVTPTAFVAIKPPMASRLSLETPWTDLATGLRQTLDAGATP